MTDNFFSELGTAPLLGRMIGPSDNTEPVVVLSEAFWRRYFTGDPSVVGKTIRLSLGALLPARRALRIDPVRALHYE